MGNCSSHMRRIVAFHEFHVRKRAVCINVDFLPGGRRSPGIVGIIVADYVATPGHIEQNGLVHVTNDVIFR